MQNFSYPRVYPDHNFRTDEDACPICQKPAYSLMYDTTGDLVGCDNCVRKTYTDVFAYGKEYTCPVCGFVCHENEAIAVYVSKKTGETVGCEECIQEIDPGKVWDICGISPADVQCDPDYDELYEACKAYLFLSGKRDEEKEMNRYVC